MSVDFISLIEEDLLCSRRSTLTITFNIVYSKRKDYLTKIIFNASYWVEIIIGSCLQILNFGLMCNQFDHPVTGPSIFCNAQGNRVLRLHKCTQYF